MTVQTEQRPRRRLARATDDSWKEEGLCREVDLELWFPNKGEPTEPAKSICRRCAVQVECLADALRNDEKFGVWGGYSERERRKLKKAS